MNQYHVVLTEVTNQVREF